MAWAEELRGAFAVMSTARMKQMGFIRRRSSRPVVCVQALLSTRREGRGSSLGIDPSCSCQANGSALGALPAVVAARALMTKLVAAVLAAVDGHVTHAQRLSGFVTAGGTGIVRHG